MKQKCNLLFALLLAACARDLSLPAAAAAPVVSDFSPAQAFAGEALLVHGQAFDPVPARNQVHFAAAAAQGESFDASGALVVHVPIDAGSGPLAVASVAGLGGASAASFNYRGIGHLRTGQIASTLPILHRPPAIAAANGDVYVASTLFRFVQSRQGKLFHLAHKPASLAVALDQSALYASTADDPLEHFFYRIDLAAAKIGPPITAAFFPHALAAAASGGAPLLVVAGDDGVATGYLSLYRGDATMALLQGPWALPVSRVLSAVATPDGGRAVLVAQRQTGAAGVETGVLVVDLTSASGARTWVAAPGGGVPTGAIATMPPDVAVGFDDGTVGDLALGSTPAWVAPLIDTLSRSPVAGLALFNSSAGPRLLASKPVEGSVLGLDVSKRNIAWGIPVRGNPIALAADPAGTLYVADSTSNFVDAIDGARGVWLNRISFEPGLGNVNGAACGAAYNPLAITGTEPEFLVAAPKAYAVLVIGAESLQIKKPLNLVRGSTSLATCVGVAPDNGIWVLHQSEIGLYDRTAKKEVILVKGLPVPPTSLGFTPDGRPLVGFPGQAMVLNADGTTAGGVVFDGALDLLAGKGAQIFATWTNAGAKPVVPHAGLWTPADFVAGKGPAAQFQDSTSNTGYAGSISLPDRALLFYDATASAVTAVALPLDGALQPGPQEEAPVKVLGPILAAPDGRYFLWTRLRVPDLILHLTRAIAGQAIVNVADMQMAGPFSGAVFSPAGEKLLAPIDSADVVQVFE